MDLESRVPEVTEEKLVEIREKYRIERDRRVVDSGRRQFRDLAEDFPDFSKDPWALEPVNREILDDEVEVIIVGAGFGGLLMGASLRKIGIERIRLIDVAAGVGGTWYWNRFPGARCDVESYVYMPLLEELGYIPSEKYVTGEEILHYCERIADHFDLYRDACFQTEVKSMQWDEASARWHVRTEQGDTMRAQYVCMSTGILHRGKLPGLPGIETFRGTMFHTSRWDYDYTGGSPTEPMDRLADKRVAMVGTGATAIQCIPELAASAAHLYVFQRTPSTIDVRGNAATDPGWAAQLQPGWQQQRMDNFDHVTSGVRVDNDIVSDGWSDINHRMLSYIAEKTDELPAEQLARLPEVFDLLKMEELRERVDALVDDADTAALLKPWYRRLCKRPCFHDEYLQTYNRDNVTLVDTDGKGVEAISANAIIANGRSYEVDCIVFATGFDFFNDFERRARCEVTGVAGQDLNAKWAEGIESLHGMQTSGFPNWFVLGNLQSTATVSWTHTLQEQARHIAYIIGQVRERGAESVDVSPQAEAAWVETILGRDTSSRELFDQCTPSYYNLEGKSHERADKNGAIMPPREFFEMMQDWRASGELAGLELR